MRHSLDPVNLHRGAEKLGELVGRGLIDTAEAGDAVILAVKKLPASVGVDRSGLRCRLHWAMADAARSVELDRSKSARSIRAAIGPLLKARAPGREIQAAAKRARGVLTEDEACAVALEQALRAVTP